MNPDKIYNFAAQSFVGVSFEQPSLTAVITGIGAVNLLEEIGLIDPKIRFYQASTSEMLGKIQAVPQIESTPVYPRSLYRAAKRLALWLAVNWAPRKNPPLGPLRYNSSQLKIIQRVRNEQTLGDQELPVCLAAAGGSNRSPERSIDGNRGLH
jgi:hypothetical protein